MARIAHESAVRVEQAWAAHLGTGRVETLRRALRDVDAVAGTET